MQKTVPTKAMTPPQWRCLLLLLLQLVQRPQSLLHRTPVPTPNRRVNEEPAFRRFPSHIVNKMAKGNHNNISNNQT